MREPEDDVRPLIQGEGEQARPLVDFFGNTTGNLAPDSNEGDASFLNGIGSRIAAGFAESVEDSDAPARGEPEVSSPRIWPGAASQGVYMLSVYRRDASGNWYSIGQLSSDATEADLIQLGQGPGTYRAVGVNEYGEEYPSSMRAPRERKIAPDHVHFRQPQRASADGARHAGPATVSPESELLVRLLAERQAQLDKQAERLAAQEAAARAQRDQAAAVVQEGATTVQLQLMSSFDERERARQATMQEAVASAQAAQAAAQAAVVNSMRDGFGAQMQAMILQMQAAQAEATARAAQQRMDHEQRMADERAKFERELRERESREREIREERDRKEERERREREAKEEREHRDRLEREAKEEERRREHEKELARMRAEADKLMMERLASKDPIGSIVGAVTSAAPLMKLLGVDLTDIKGLISGGESKGVISSAIETAGNVMTEWIKAQTKIAALDDGEEGDEDEEGDGDGEPGERPALADDPIVEVRFADGNTRQMRRSEAEALLRQQSTTAAPGAASAPTKPQPVESAGTDERKARQAIARLVDALGDFPEIQWPKIIPEFLAGAPELTAWLVSGVPVVADELERAEAPPQISTPLLALLTAAQAAGTLPPTVRIRA